MAKPDAAALNPARYPFCTNIDVRFGDMDINLHVNNVAMAGMVEEGRVRFHRASGFSGSMRGMGAMVASMAIDYVGQAHYPGELTIHAGAARLGSSSYDLQMLILQQDRTVAFARSTMVCVTDGKPHGLPDSFRESVKQWMLRP